MKCCECKCPFKECIKERKEDLNEEFKNLITNWLKEHPEITKIYISNNALYFTNSFFLYPDRELKITTYFE